MESECGQFKAEERCKASMLLFEVSNAGALAARLDYTLVGHSHGLALHLEIPSAA